MLSLMGIGLRAFLMLIAAIVLSLSITLARHQAIGAVPAETGFGTFVGAIGFISSVFGMAALWLDHIDGKLLMGLDAVVAFIYLAGAVSLTAAMQTVSSCTAMDDHSQYNRYMNKILNAGCIHTDKGPLCPQAVSDDGKDLTVGRCEAARADYSFQFVGFLFGMLMVCLGYILTRRGRGGTPAANRPGTEY